ncbi:hypothetical protein LTR56_015870 [Elasticomyces elasticus]|nr:hypothetical protein LTR56_015870 [Elasticomyces elasticus]KAK3640032.1 hypothetical protein LTR22_017190 [Elasticomyces elasticus]KAK4908222.1 hypothetical protein LTR49_022867 [Elasticomyces elasticus]KAK5754987.1 hypothetical protein LTS12_014903 [Elasticomyces elasticus]
MAIYYSVPALLLLVIPTALAFIILQRLYAHPLSNIPGPRIAALTTWWETYIDVFQGAGSQFYSHLRGLHDKRGPIVRIGPNEVHISDPEWLRTLFGGPGTVRDKHPSLAHVAGSSMGTFGAVDHFQHRQRRSAVAPFFSKRAVRATEARVQAITERLCLEIDRCYKTGDSLNVRVTTLAWFTDAVASYVFDNPAQMLGDQQLSEQWYGMFEKMRGMYPLMKQALWIVPLSFQLPPQLVSILSPNLSPLLKVHRDMTEQAKLFFDARRHGMTKETASEESPNLFRAILDSKLPEEDKNYHRIAHEGLEVLLAGSNTTSKVMSRAVFHINNDAAIKARLQEELRRVMPDAGAVPDVDILKSSAYLTIISMTPGYTLHDPTIYPNPLSFMPERWLVEGEELAQMDHYFTSFGIGNRACLGKDFAISTLTTGVAMLFRRYDFELVDTIEERDITNSRWWIIGEAAADSPGFFVRPTKSWRDGSMA